MNVTNRHHEDLKFISSGMEQDESSSLLYALIMGLIVVLILVVVVFIIMRRNKRPFLPSFTNRLDETRPINRSPVFLLYAKDCPKFMEMMDAFRTVLTIDGKFEVSSKF